MNYGTGMLPYDTELQNTIPGGASLWVFAGKSDDEYKGVAAFFNFLSQTEIQARLHQVSGYLPVTLAAYEKTKADGFYDKNPAREIPIKQMLGKAPTENSRRAPAEPAAGARHHERGIREDAGRRADRPAGARQDRRARQRGDQGSVELGRYPPPCGRSSFEKPISGLFVYFADHSSPPQGGG